MKKNGLYVPNYLLDKHKNHIITMTETEFENFKCKTFSSNKDKGSCCNINYVGDKVYKEYKSEIRMNDN